MKTFREIRNLQEAPLTSRFVAGDKLWKSTGGNGDYPDLGKVNYDPTKKFHSVGKPVVVHAMRDGFHEDFIFYSDGKYVLVVSGHKQVADARGSSDEAMMYMVDAGGGFSPADLKKFAMKNAKAYMDRVLKVTDKVRDFSKEDEGSDSAPKSIKRVPFKESVEESINEAYSKNLSDREIDAQFKKFSKPEEFFGDLDQARAEMKQDYSPANSARPKAWNSLSYPVRDGDYYFAFISKNEKKNMKFNEKLNDHLKETFKSLTLSKKDVVRDVLWEKASLEVKTYPRDLGAGDTMTREEIWMSIGHMVGMNEDVKEMRDAIKTKAGIKVGRRAKAPRYEGKMKETKESKFRSFRADLKNIAEAAGFEFVDMDKKSRDTVIALAKKFKLKVKERKKGSLSNIDVEGSNANVAKFMQNLPQDALEGVQKEATSISMKDIMRKHGRELKKVARTGNLELSDRAEEDLVNWAYDNGEVMTDDPDEFIEWLDNNLDDIVKGRIR